MTQKELDIAISEIIIPLINPKHKTNSYFRKQNEKRLLRREKNYILHLNQMELHNWSFNPQFIKISLRKI